ncbi:tRNA pseudouridine(38-40) synthase TruA [bacterium]|nr:tRNA pseudouridine(38-40) synthase TruA [bacterium]MBU1991160.1 tRNA pseudouridine(38-40) synthase TruA [bacterium]
MRCALTLAYNGTHFLGSQVQSESPNTVFGEFEKVLHKLGIDFRVVASGRTDKGVHATGQVCHVELPPFWSDLEKFKRVLNEMLPHAIQVKNIKAVEDTFHARYSAKKRVYRYIIKNADSNPFENDFATFLQHVEFEKIQADIKLFEGEHDFKYFMKTGSDVNSTTRVIYKAFAYKYKGFIVLNFEANGFLRSQIRLMVGALLKLDAAQIQEQLSCQKKHRIKPAPSNGLYLAKIKY